MIVDSLGNKLEEILLDFEMCVVYVGYCIEVYCFEYD